MEGIFERIAARKISVAIVLGTVIIVVPLILTMAINQSHWMGFDLVESFTDLWIWFVTGCIGIGFTLINYGIRQRKPVKNEKETSTSEVKVDSETVLDEQTTAVLIRLAKSDYRHTLREQLNYIWKQVDEGWHPRFLIWKGLDPVLKNLLITYKPEYDALEDFTNALDQLSDNSNKADFDALKTLCKNRFDRLKELGLVY